MHGEVTQWNEAPKLLDVVRLKNNFLLSVTRENNINRSIECQAFIDFRRIICRSL